MDSFFDIIVFCMVVVAFWLIFDAMRGKKKEEKHRDEEEQELRLERAEVLFLRQILEELKQDHLVQLKQIELLKDIKKLLLHPPKHLSQIQLALGDPPMQGPLNINVGQSSVATVLGFDQNGQPFPIDFTATPATFSIDNPAFDTVTDNGNGTAGILSLAEGTATMTVNVGAFSDQSQIINAAVVVTPVLTSVKLDFSTPTP